MRRLVCLLGAIFLTVSVAWAEPVAACSRVEPGGERTLCFEAVVPVEPAAVWALWSQPAQLRTWLAPVATIELRPGGMMEAAYDAAGRLGDDANILNRVVSVAPLQSFAIQVARAPPGFPHPDEVRELVTLIEFEPVEATSTRVCVSIFGYRDGQAFDELYAFFARGNVWTLEKLNERVVDGPVNWEAQR